MFFARLAALLLVFGTAFWIYSGYLDREKHPERAHGAAPSAAPEKPLFKVVVRHARVAPHVRRFDVTGRTFSDRRVMATARSNGIVTALTIRRGASVKAGEVIAELSNEARDAQVAQAQARLAQRRAEFEARERLARQGNFPALNLEQLRAELSAAEAVLATSQAERERGIVLAPIDGIVNDVPAEIGQALQPGAQIAEIVAATPMLVVAEVPERRLAGISIGEKADIRLVTGETLAGTIRFIARRASAQTRTYRVDIEVPNDDGRLVDGIAAAVRLALAPEPATEVPRSALTFSSEGRLGVRIVGPDGIVGFVPVALVDDTEDSLFVSGVGDGMAVIVRGQEFVAEGQKVSALLETAARESEKATQ